MQKDLVTSIGTALLGAIAAFFICNLFLGPIEDVSFKSVDPNLSIDITEPDPEVFNYQALNPTVEVYVGDCTEYDDYGECIDDETVQSLEEVVNDQSTNPNTENR